MPPAPILPNFDPVGDAISFKYALSWDAIEKNSSAFQIIILRIVLSSIVLACVIAAVLLNWDSWTTTQHSDLKNAGIVYMFASFSLVVNVAHLKRMSVIYKAYSTVIFVVELLFYSFVTIVYVVFAGFYYLLHPIKLLQIGVTALFNILMIKTAINMFTIIQKTPNGDLDQTIKFM